MTPEDLAAALLTAEEAGSSEADKIETDPSKAPSKEVIEAQIQETLMIRSQAVADAINDFVIAKIQELTEDS